LGEETAQRFVRYDANEEVANDESDGTMSLKSNDSEEDEERDTFTMKMEGHAEFGLHWVVVEPEPDQWSTRFEAIDVEEKPK
jgi:hypothetical protein